MRTITEDNYFEYAEAIYCFCSLNHDGQNSELYSILSQSEFRPGMLWSESRCESENSVYSELTESNISELFNELCGFLNSKSEVSK